ncbi:MAG: sigma-70 family RNA polymerase sigma factor [Bacteroidales bacterium]|nr:sigma-70 family RNA polymerase sigma factor [Bacteroidales bacterium]
MDGEKSFPAYIQSIARHLIYNQLKRAVYKQRFIDLSLQKGEISENLAEEYIHFRELQQILENAVSELPPRRREIFNLSRNEGLSYKEIASRLSVQESTVNTQISKAIEFLREKLKDYRLTLWIF